MKTGIIIPCYNEEKRLNVNTFVEFIQTHNQYHLCFVNDGSKDNTLSVLEEIKKQAKTKISIVDVKKNAGKAAAVRSGARYLFNRQDVDYIGFIDADLSTNFNDFKKLVETLHNNDQFYLVYGSRGKGDGRIERNLIRKVCSAFVKMIVFLILGLPIEDTQCGAKVFRRQIIPVAFDKKFLTRWLFDVEIFIRMKKYFGSKQIMNRMYEQPLELWVHVEDSKLGLKDSLKIPFMLINIWYSYRIAQLFSDSNTVDNQVVFEEVNIISTNNSNQQIAA
ncbi:glycosyl transferase family 2 [Flavobacteriales bacterium 34_180_T64]|nr:glycosyl transferase family 2 [Flavobacteriales bacterium 34_180_T64]